ncbi:MAG: hypothetical protein WCR97_03650 [Bacilli bacterium]
MRKKICTIFFVLLQFGFVFGGENSKNQSIYNYKKNIRLDAITFDLNDPLDKNFYSLKLGNKILEHFNLLNSNNVLSSNNKAFAGIFIDKNNTLNINSTTVSFKNDIDEYLSSYVDCIYKINLVSNSYYSLNTIKNDFLLSNINYVNKIYISEKENIVKIDLLDAVDNVNLFITKKGINPECLDFINEKDDEIFSNSQIKAGEKIVHDITRYGTAGFNAIDNDTNKCGVVTNAHVAGLTSFNNTYLDNGTIIGKGTKRCFSSNNDSAFILFSFPSTFASTRYIVSSDQSFYISSSVNAIEGANVWSIGATTGSTYGNIISTNCSINVDYGDFQEIKNDVISYNNNKSSGDSGCPLLDWSNRLSAKNIFGIHFASGNNYSYAIKINNVLNCLNVSIY